ncbi:glutamate receptor ionotropic, kainate 3-like [Rhipicephalus microplus]|uniref:glutamate receptor ionotropic, kainate 3-like n=1 Tax=Rhipicephalus microplus TaxID=6941 RepID=UPI003F6A66C6
MEHCHRGTDTWFPAAADVAQFEVCGPCVGILTEYDNYITATLSEPYVLLRKDSKSASAGEDRLDGYCVDILRQMALLLEFCFELRLVRDGTYGVVNTRGEWSGIIREVMNRLFIRPIVKCELHPNISGVFTLFEKWRGA